MRAVWCLSLIYNTRKMSTKRKHITLNLKEKNDIIEKLNKGISIKLLADKYGVGRATIYDIQKKKEQIQQFVSNVDTAPGSRKTLKTAENPEIETALYTWFLQERRRNTPISGPLLTGKAKFYYEKITQKTDFNASCGWLDGFKRRHGIRFLKTKGEKLSSDVTHVEEFKQQFLQKISDLNLSPSQIYNADESGLFWRVLPNKTFVSSQETDAFGHKLSKERVTFLPCANASGQHTLKLLVISKSKKPRTFKNIDLPVHYFGQKKAWMTRELFKKWFFGCFVPKVRQWLKEHNLPPKALLLLDNAPSHPPADELISDDKLITLMFMPPNCTPLLQPMDQCVIQCIKENYKKKLLFDAVSKDESVVLSLKKLNIKDMVFLLTLAWNSLKPRTIISSWKPIWPNIHLILNSPDVIVTDVVDLHMTAIIQTVSDETGIQCEELQEWCNSSNEQNIGAEFLSDEEIVENAIDTGNEEEEEDDDDDDPTSSTNTKKASEAVQCFDYCIGFAEEQGFTYAEILLLKRMQDKALKIKNQRMVQKKLDDFILDV